MWLCNLFILDGCLGCFCLLQAVLLWTFLAWIFWRTHIHISVGYIPRSRLAGPQDIHKFFLSKYCRTDIQSCCYFYSSQQWMRVLVTSHPHHTWYGSRNFWGSWGWCCFLVHLGVQSIEHNDRTILGYQITVGLITAGFVSRGIAEAELKSILSQEVRS